MENSKSDTVPVEVASHATMGFRERAFALYITFLLDGSPERGHEWRYDQRADVICRGGVEVPIWSEGQQSCRMLAQALTWLGRPMSFDDAVKLAGGRL